MLYKCVWLIDDDPVSNFMAEMQISLNKFAEKVKTFTSAEDALEVIKKARNKGDVPLPDAIFLDISMPVLSGWEFLEEFRNLPEEKKNNCDLYMLSSSVDQRDITLAEKSEDVCDFISKPLSAEDLEVIKLQKSGEQFM